MKLDKEKLEHNDEITYRNGLVRRYSDHAKMIFREDGVLSAKISAFNNELKFERNKDSQWDIIEVRRNGKVVMKEKYGIAGIEIKI